MFKHILVPLDGSSLAEAALPPAAWLAEKLGSQVTLLHIIEQNPPQDIHGEHHLRDEGEACEYLTATRARGFKPGQPVECHTHTEGVRDVARSIVDHNAELNPDLIIMCTHGKGGLRDLMAGPIAQQVIGLGRVPVLLIQPEAPFQPCRSILVALDGDPEHTRSLEAAGGLAAEIKASLHLVNVVATLDTLRGEHAATGRLLPAATSMALDLEEECMADYLDELSVPWRQRGVQVIIETRRGDPAGQIGQAAQDKGDDLVVLGTHGKAGMSAFWAGSVAAQIPGHTRLPLLLIPVHSGAQS